MATMSPIMADAYAIAARIGGEVGGLPLSDAELSSARLRQPIPKVSRRREKVRQARARGMTQSEIAADFGVPLQTIKNDCRAIAKEASQ